MQTERTPMQSDQLSYKRATVVSLIGLGIQSLLTLVLLLYSLIASDSAAMTGALYLLLGLPVWFALSLVFHQHRLAAIESTEEEMLRTSSAAQASVFQEAGGDLRVAGRKLEWMHRYLLPAVSLLVGGALLVVGWMRYSTGVEIMRNPDAALPGLTGWAMTIGLCTAAIGFIFARFVAGMAKQEVWSNLRAGASWAVGAAVVGLLIAVAHGVSFAASDALLQRLPVIIPIIMGILGIEIFLNFVLSVYRPRKPGEYPRPAFDSRVLGFLAAPDRIAESISEAVNYQFGLDVSSTWFYQLFSRSLAFLLLVGGLVIWGLTAVAVVSPDEKAIVLRTGKLQRVLNSSVEPKLPWPFERVERYPAQHISELQLGAPPHTHDHDDAPILWTEDHGVEEHFMLVKSSREGSSSSVATDDFALVSAEIPLQYIVDDLETYIWLAADSDDPNDPDKHRRELLQAVAVRVVTETLATKTIDAVLGADRDAINAELHDRIETRFAELNIDPETGEPRGAGVNIVFVGIVGAHPPFGQQVGESFEYVVNADQRREATIEQARAQAIRTLASVAGDVELARNIITELNALERLSSSGASDEQVTEQRLAIEDLIYEAGGEAAGLLLKARADRWVRHMDVRGRATRQTGRLAMYNAAPEVYLAGLYLDALREAVRPSRLYITTFDAPSITVNFENVESTFDDLLEETRAREEN